MLQPFPPKMVQSVRFRILQLLTQHILELILWVLFHYYYCRGSKSSLRYWVVLSVQKNMLLLQTTHYFAGISVYIIDRVGECSLSSNDIYRYIEIFSRLIVSTILHNYFFKLHFPAHTSYALSQTASKSRHLISGSTQKQIIYKRFVYFNKQPMVMYIPYRRKT